MSNVKRQTRAGNPVVTQAGTAGAPNHLTDLDVVYVVREGETNESLIYSLRSLDNIPHGKVFISGGCPPELKGVYHIQKDAGGMEMPDQEDSNLNLFLASINPDLSDDFIFMNDDFFILKKLPEIPVMHQGSLDERIAAYRSDNRFHQAYSLIRTRDVLMTLNNYNPAEPLLSYELHMPMVMNKYKLAYMFEMWRSLGLELFALRPRTMYGNMYKLKGVNTRDAKNTVDTEGRFTSTGVDFDISLAGDIVRREFSKPGAYEQAYISGGNS